MARHAQKGWSAAKRWSVAAGLALLVIGAGALVIATRGGDDAWERAKAELAAKGERLDWNELIPPHVLPEENFFGHPIVEEILPPKGARAKATIVPQSVTIQAPGPAASPQVQKAQTNNMPAPLAKTDKQPIRPLSLPPENPLDQQPQTIAWLKTLPRTEAEAGTNLFTLEGLDEWFGQWDQTLEALREANKRPYAHYTGDYSNPINAPIPNFVAARALAQGIASRANIHLLRGEGQEALKDLDALAALMRGLRGSPGTLVSAMIHTALGGLYVSVVVGGLTENLWKPEDLEGLFERMSAINLIAPVQQALRQGERCGIGRIFEMLAETGSSPNRLAGLAAVSSPGSIQPRDVAVRLAPRSWIRRNQATHALLLQGFIEAMDGKARRYYPKRNAAASAAVATAFKRWSPHTMLAELATPNFQKAGATMALNQTKVDQCAIVAALLWHKARHGSYPESLSALDARFLSALPKDVFTGEDYRYRKNGDAFLLYSIGPNEVDDGGSSAALEQHDDISWPPRM